jgi:putative ABC transport system permease protein
MIGSYVKTSVRNISRNKLFSTINIAGLAISMSVGLLVISLVHDLLSYDAFHENSERIYRVISSEQVPGQPPMELASSSVVTAKKIAEEFTGVEEVTSARRGFGGDAVIGDQKIPLGGMWADDRFLKVFSFRLKEGDAATALKEPYSIVLTEKTAKRLFGESDAMGKTIVFDTTAYRVTGVLKDIPKLSHFRFEALVSFSTVEIQKPDFDGGFLSWGNIYFNYTYILLPDNADADKIQLQLDQLCATQNKSIEGKKVGLSLQALTGISVGKRLGNQIGPHINAIAIWIMAGLAVVVILSACFNYTNLSVARSLRRTKEIGIRKVIGAGKRHVLAQFIAEAVIIALASLVFSFLIFLFLRTEFLSIHPFLADLFSLELSGELVIRFIVLAASVGLLAGILPAIYYARVNAIRVLKDAGSVKVFHHVNLRKSLIVIQYMFSLMFIASTIIGYQQYRGFLTFDLGFRTDNIFNLNLQGNSSERVKKELLELPFVTGVSKSTIVTSIGNIYGMTVRYNDPHDSAGVWLNFVDEHYLPLHRHTFLAGRNFKVISPTATESEVIVNEQLLKRFHIANANPQNALGEEIIVDKGQKLTIVGVLRDFHYGTMEDQIQPMIFRYSDNPGGVLNVKINATDLPAAMEALETTWKKIDGVHAFDGKFYDDQISQAYSQFSLMIRVVGFLAFLAVCIASMGLFGMVVFTTETKMKEISIRKVLGAGEGKLVLLLSRGFIVLLGISALVALPMTWLFFDKVVLTNFAYHQPLGALPLVITVLIVMGIAFVMIGTQTLKAARTNPADVLKVE